MTFVSRLVLGLVLVARSAGASPAPTPHVLEDREADGVRRMTIVVARGEACVATQELRTRAPFSLQVRSACAVELTGPASAAPQLAIGGEELELPAPPHAAMPPTSPPRGDASDGESCSVVPAGPLVIGHQTTGAFLLVTIRGRPARDVDLNVRALGGRLRALTWTRPGVARVDLVAPRWSESGVELVVACGGVQHSARIPIDPGPPIRASIEIPPTHVGRRTHAAVGVTTPAGVAIAPSRRRLVAPTCEVDDLAITCDRPGRARISLHVEHRGVWVPIAWQELEIVPVVVRRTTTRPARPPSRTWEVTGAGGRATDGAWTTGVAATVVHPWRPRLALTTELAWQVGQQDLAPAAPVAGTLGIVEHEVRLGFGITTAPRPWLVRIAAGPALAHQRGELAGASMSSVGLRGHVEVTAGSRLGSGRHAVVLDVGARASADLIAPSWRAAALLMFVEVGVARR